MSSLFEIDHTLFLDSITSRLTICAVVMIPLLILRTPKTTVPVEGIPMVPNSHWFFGHMSILVSDFRESWWKLCYEHANEDGLCSFWHFSRPAITVNTVEHARAVLNNSSVKPKMKHLRNHMKMILGESSLLWLVGKEWKYHRSLYSKGLTNKHLTAMLEPIQEVALSLVRTLQAKIDKEHQSASTKMDITKLIHMAIVDVSGKIFFGMDFKCCENLKQHPFTEKVNFVEDEMLRRIASPLNPAAQFYGFPCAKNRQYMESIQYIRSTLQMIIQKRRLALSSPSTSNDVDFIASLLKSLDEQSEQPKDPKEIDDCIIDTLMTAHMASFASSTTTLLYTFYCLACNPKVEQKCLEEIEKVVNRDSDTLNPDNFSYCNAVVTETMRLYSANVAMGRTLEKPLKLGKTTVPAGIDVLIPYWFIMRDECNFPRALEFLPERWVKRDDNGAWVEHSTVDISKVNSKDEGASQISASSDETTVPESNPCQKKNTAESESSLVNDVVPAGNKLAFLPFSIGARNCVGLKLASKTMCIIFVELLRHLKFELVPGFKIDPKTSGVGLKHNGEIPMIISKR